MGHSNRRVGSTGLERMAARFTGEQYCHIAKGKGLPQTWVASCLAVRVPVGDADGYRPARDILCAKPRCSGRNTEWFGRDREQHLAPFLLITQELTQQEHAVQLLFGLRCSRLRCCLFSCASFSIFHVLHEKTDCWSVVVAGAGCCASGTCFLAPRSRYDRSAPHHHLADVVIQSLGRSMSSGASAR